MKSTLTVLVLLPLFLGGCGAQDSLAGLERPGTPSVVGSADVTGYVRSRPEHSVSPDRRYLVATVTDARGIHLVLVDIAGGELAVSEVESVCRGTMERAALSLEPVGWASEDNFLYARTGWQPRDSGTLRRGIAVLAGTPGSKGGRELAFLDLPAGYAKMHFVWEKKRSGSGNIPTPMCWAMAKRRL